MTTGVHTQTTHTCIPHNRDKTHAHNDKNHGQALSALYTYAHKQSPQVEWVSQHQHCTVIQVSKIQGRQRGNREFKVIMNN